MLGGLFSMFGVNPGVWLMLLVIAWYLFRGARAGRKAGSILGRAIMYVIIVLVSFGVAAAMSWADLHVAQFLSDMKTAAEVGMRFAGEYIDDAINLSEVTK